MKTFSVTFFCLGFLLFVGMFLDPGLRAQDFPYSVPQAPEFDGRGNHIEPAPADDYAPRKRSGRHSEHLAPGNGRDLRSVRPYAPNGSQPMVAPPPRPAVPPAGYAARPAPAVPPHQSHTHLPSSPQQAPAANQGRPDCSQYPMMIARARSETEMRGVAQMYLTCLLQSGWSIDEAKKHVITTIESTYRLAR